MVWGFKRRSLHRVQQQIHDLWVSSERRRQVSAGWRRRQWEHRDGAKEMELSSSGMQRASDEAALKSFASGEQHRGKAARPARKQQDVRRQQ